MGLLDAGRSHPYPRARVTFSLPKGRWENRMNTQEVVLKVDVRPAPPNSTKECLQHPPFSSSSPGSIPCTLSVPQCPLRWRELQAPSVCVAVTLWPAQWLEKPGHWLLSPLLRLHCPSPVLASLASPFLLFQTHREFSWVPVVGAGVTTPAKRHPAQVPSFCVPGAPCPVPPAPAHSLCTPGGSASTSCFEEFSPHYLRKLSRGV